MLTYLVLIRDEYLNSNALKNIIVWNCDAKKGPSSRHTHTAVHFCDWLILIGGSKEVKQDLHDDLLIYDLSKL